MYGTDRRPTRAGTPSARLRTARRSRGSPTPSRSGRAGASTGPHRPTTPGYQAVLLALVLVGLWAANNPVAAAVLAAGVAALVWQHVRPRAGTRPE